MKPSVEKSRSRSIIATCPGERRLPTRRRCAIVKVGVEASSKTELISTLSSEIQGRIGLFQIVWAAVPHSFHGRIGEDSSLGAPDGGPIRCYLDAFVSCPTRETAHGCGRNHGHRQVLEDPPATAKARKTRQAIDFAAIGSATIFEIQIQRYGRRKRLI